MEAGLLPLNCWTDSGPMGSTRAGADRRALKAEIVAQSGTGIVLAEFAAALEFRHHQPDKILLGARHMGCRQHEAVTGAALEPCFHLIGDFLAGAEKGRQLAQR